PHAALAALMAGRALMGCAESLIVTGALSWGVGRVGPRNAGRVTCWPTRRLRNHTRRWPR
ncbi:hypothetical protein ACDY95_18180, partial [Achromobacter ruhlandii]